MSEVIAIDFETFYSKKLKYSVKTMIAEQYAKSHLFDAYMVSVSDGENTWAGHPRDFNWQSLEGKILLSHNSYFDETVYEELVRRGLAPQINFKEWHCTANLTSYLCNMRALDQAVEHLYGVKISKADRADAVEKHWPQDFTEEQRASMLKYARNDAHWCWKLWADFSHRWPETERQLSRMTIDQGKRGVQIDAPLLDQYLIQTHEMKMSAEGQIPWIVDSEEDEWAEFTTKPTSTKCIAEQCRLSGIPCCPVKSDDEEAYEEWEKTYAPTHLWIYAVGAWRSINKLYKTFQTVKERLRPDGTLPFGLKYFGAHTGRWSTEAKINLLNMRKRPVFCAHNGLLEINEKKITEALRLKEETGAWPEWVKYAIDFRQLIIPRPGYKMVVSDLSQIEPRVLAWLVGDHAMLSMVSQGMSVYEAHCRSSMGWTGGNLKKENPSLYALCKARVLALGYQAGWEKFILMSQVLAGIDVTEGDPETVEETCQYTGKVSVVSGYGFTSRAIVKAFREQNPGIKGMWTKLDGAFKSSVGSDFTMTLPNGRQMTYTRVRADVRIEKNRKTGKPEKKSVYTTLVSGRRVPSYGGKLTENLVQAISRDIFAEHLLALEAAGHRVLFGVHDEAVIETKLDNAVENVQSIMSVCPNWLKGCPISAEAHQVERYCK